VLGLGPTPEIAPTQRDVLRTEGTSKLYRFRAPGREPARGGAPLLLVPSLINRWYVLDLRRGASLVEHLVEEGIDTYLLDWGAPEAEDRFRTWDDAIARVGRNVRAVQRITGHAKVGVLGYSSGATLAAIWTALHPGDVSSLINLAGPFDFSHGLRMVDRRWFDADAIAEAGNVPRDQLRTGFVALRPTLPLVQCIEILLAHSAKPEVVAGIVAMERWASDTIPFPAAAYATYVRDLYQDNQLIRGEHVALGRRVDLHNIRCPVLTVAADRDNVCPPSSSRALNDRVGSEVRALEVVPGGHVSAVVGSHARAMLYPKISDFLKGEGQWS
jgi:polyhydroxyalkanoate synthase